MMEMTCVSGLPAVEAWHNLHRPALSNSCSWPYAPKDASPGPSCVCEMFRNLMETVGMSDFKPRNRQTIPLAPGPASRNVELAAMYDVWQSHARSSGGVLWLSSTASGVGFGESKDKTPLGQRRECLSTTRYSHRWFWPSNTLEFPMKTDVVHQI